MERMIPYVRQSPLDAALRSQLDEQLKESRRRFFEYLRSIPNSGGAAKHTVMGAVGKILSEARRGRFDAGYLSGYALRADEATRQRAKGYGSQRMGIEELSNLEEGIRLLSGIMSDAPIASRESILDALDYGLYFDLRKAQLERFEKEVREPWERYLSSKYPDGEALSQVYKTREFSRVPVPKKKPKGGSPQQQEDARQFWEGMADTRKDADVLATLAEVEEQE